MTFQVSLIKPENAVFDFNGFELENLTKDELKSLNLNYGVRIKKVTNKNYLAYQEELEGSILLTINRNKITNTQVADQILNNSSSNSKFRLELLNTEGTFIRILL